MSILKQFAQGKVANARSGIRKPELIVNRNGDDGELFLYDIIGFEEFGGVSAKNFVNELRRLDGAKRITIHINSPGGAVNDGLAMYNQLALHPAHKTVYVDGEASSIASVIAMAGDHIVMFPESNIMIHEARLLATAGTAADLRKQAEELEAHTSSIRDIYARRTGLDTEKLAEMMSAETTMRAAEAVDLKFADEIQELPQRQERVAAIKIQSNLSPIQVARLRAQLAGRRSQ